MNHIKQLCRSLISGALAFTVICTDAPIALSVKAISDEASDVLESADVLPDMSCSEGSIAFIAEETAVTDIPAAGTATGTTTTGTYEAAKAVPKKAVSMAEENGFRYYISAGNTVIDSYIGDEAAVSIPETLGGLPVKEIGYAAFSGNHKLTAVTIPDTVTRINHDAFHGCISLVSTVLPESITSIQDGAFAGCSSLRSVVLPESITRIEDNTFSGCAQISEISLNTNIDYIGKSAFAGCVSLCTAVIPDSVTAIGNMAFSGSGIVTLTIPDTVTSLGSAVFSDCKSLKEITLPKYITKLKSADRAGTFSGCISLEQITFPAELSELEAYTFSGCSALKNIALPETVTKVGAAVFKGCTALEHVDLPETVRRLEDELFSGCESLSAIPLHREIKYICSGVFENCLSLKYIEIPEKTALIGDNCFYNCDSLTEMTIPESVTTLGSGALAGCDMLQKVYLPDQITELRSSQSLGTFSDDISLTEVKLPASLTTIGAYTFMNCVSLKQIVLPETVSSIYTAAFEGCISLRSAELPDAIRVISERAFHGCTSLRSVILPKNIDEVKNEAFADCISLFDLGEKAGYFKFAEKAFTGCTVLDDARATVFKNDTPSVTVSTAAKIIGGIANFSIKYDLNDWIRSGFADSSNPDIRFSLPLPSGLELIESSVLTDTADNQVKFIGNNHDLVTLSKPAGTLRFSARITAYTENDYEIDPKISFRSHGYSWVQGIPRMTMTVPKITISAQGTISSRDCDIYGIAEPDKKVKIFADGELVATVKSNPYTGKYTASVSLPEKKDDTAYLIYAASGVDRTDEISVVYTDAKPSIRKVDLIYCTHAPSDTNDYMETLDITGVFTRGERPVIQYYPKGNMRFKIEATHPERISCIVVRSRKGSESKCLVARYDETEQAFITKENQYFDESNHNYVPGSLNFIIFEKSVDVIDEAELDTLRTKLDTSETEFAQIDDKSAVSGCRNTDGERLTDCYYYGASSVSIGGKSVTAQQIADAPETYGFSKCSKKLLRKGVLYTIYSKIIRYSEVDLNSESKDSALERSLLDQVNVAYNKAGGRSYDMKDYLIFAQVVAADDGSVPMYISVLADAQKNRPQYVDNDLRKELEEFRSRGTIEIRYNSAHVTAVDGEDDDEKTVGEKSSDAATESAKNNVKDSFLDLLFKKSKIKKIIDTGKDAKDIYDAVEEEKNKEDTPSTGSKERDAYRKQIDDLQSGFHIWSTFNEKIVNLLPGGGELLGPATEGVDEQVPDLLEKEYQHNDEILKYLDPEYLEDGQVQTILDPSGIVYEGIRSKTISGAKVTCYVLNEDTDEWEVWNAADYDQTNPLITDAAGSYAWDVPEGRYYVTCEKEGYALIKSNEFDVAPPKFDLDFNLSSQTAPSVSNYALSENQITIRFSKVMDIATVNSETVSIDGWNGKMSITPQLYAPDDRCTDSFVITGDFSKMAVFTLSVNSKATDYTGAALTAYSAEIRNIYADLILEKDSVKLISEDTYQIRANKKTVSYASADPKIAVADKNGIVTGISEGETKITVLDETGKEAVLTISVEERLVLDADKMNLLCEQAITDYQKKNETAAASAVCKIVDNKCEIELKDKDGNLLDTYTIDPNTGKGTDSANKAVDLPQTGTNAVNDWMYAVAAILLIGFGVLTLQRSGVYRRRKSVLGAVQDPENEL